MGLWRNQIREIPSEIGSLTNLTALDLRRNQISAIPSAIGGLTNLTELDLGDNRISVIPPEIGSLTNLTELDLGDNQIREIPSAIANLTNLTELRLRANPLTAATRVFIDTIRGGDGLRITYDMSAHEQVNSEMTGLNRLYPEEEKRAETLGEINALGAVEKQAVKTFLSRIQNSKYWYSDRLFNQYFKTTIHDMLSGMGYDSPGNPNQILQDIVKSSAGCGTNSTGTVFSYYAKSAIAKWLKDNDKGKTEYADLVRIGGVLKSDIIHIALQEYASALISENDIDGDRAEAIADLLRIASGASFNFRAHDYKIANPLTLPDSISGYGLTANNRAKEVFLFGLCKTKDDGSLDISSSNGLTIDESKLEVIVNNYLAMHDISVSDGMGWFTRLSSILKDPSKMIPDNELKDNNEAIRRIYQTLYSAHYDVIEGDEFIKDLTQIKNSEKLVAGVHSEGEYLDKVLGRLNKILRDVKASESKVSAGESNGVLQKESEDVPKRGFDYNGVATIAGVAYFTAPQEKQDVPMVELGTIEPEQAAIMPREQSSDNSVPEASTPSRQLERVRSRAIFEEIER